MYLLKIMFIIIDMEIYSVGEETSYKTASFNPIFVKQINK